MKTKIHMYALMLNLGHALLQRLLARPQQAGLQLQGLGLGHQLRELRRLASAAQVGELAPQAVLHCAARVHHAAAKAGHVAAARRLHRRVGGPQLGLSGAHAEDFALAPLVLHFVHPLHQARHAGPVGRTFRGRGGGCSVRAEQGQVLVARRAERRVQASVLGFGAHLRFDGALASFPETRVLAFVEQALAHFLLPEFLVAAELSLLCVARVEEAWVQPNVFGLLFQMPKDCLRARWLQLHRGFTRRRGFSVFLLHDLAQARQEVGRRYSVAVLLHVGFAGIHHARVQPSERNEK